jgi:FkbM family methyltransferase
MNRLALTVARRSRNAFRSLGLEVGRYGDGLADQRSRILRATPECVVWDVGANTGQYGQDLRDADFHGLIVSFEPNSRAFHELKVRASRNEPWQTERVALGRSAGVANLNIAKNSQSSSLMPMLPTHYMAAPTSVYIDTEAVQVKSLDSFASVCLGPAYLKIDTQGFEMEVLEGAVTLLTQVIALEVELSLVPLYDDAPLMPEVLTHLYDMSFRLIALERVFWDRDSGRTLQINGLLRPKALL